MRSRPTAAETAAVLDDRAEQVHASSRAEVQEAHRRIRNGDLTCPVLYVYGRNDITVPHSAATGAVDLLAQENPKARLSVYTHCGHVPQRERPDEFAQEVVDFVDRWH